MKKSMSSNRWSAQVTEKSNALDLESGIFKNKSPRKIARSLKISADKSTRRKSSPYRSAMSMLNFYINRAGTNLKSPQREILERTKTELKNLYQSEEDQVKATRLKRNHSIARFQVMAVLQAARAYYLGLDLDEAKSWGLNRALFYAAAKRGWARAKREGARRPVISEFEFSRARHDPIYVLGGEKAFRSRNYSKGLRFKFGSETQEPEDFDDQVKRKFGDDWDEVWSEAIKMIRKSERRDLDIQSRFFNNVYKPRRDLLVERWSISKAKT